MTTPLIGLGLVQGRGDQREAESTDVSSVGVYFRWAAVQLVHAHGSNPYPTLIGRRLHQSVLDPQGHRLLDLAMLHVLHLATARCRGTACWLATASWLLEDGRGARHWHGSNCELAAGGSARRAALARLLS
jgi:hypothetical protein